MTEVTEGIGEPVKNHNDIVLAKRTAQKIFGNVTEQNRPDEITPLEEFSHIERHWGGAELGSQFEPNEHFKNAEELSRLLESVTREIVKPEDHNRPHIITLQFSSNIGRTGVVEIQDSDIVTEKTRDYGKRGEKDVNVVTRTEMPQTDLVTFEVRPFVDEQGNAEFKLKAAFPGEPAPSLFSTKPEDVQFWDDHAFVEVKPKVETTIPDSLKEFGEVPPGYKSVYFYTRKELLPQLGERGIIPEDNTMDERAGEDVRDGVSIAQIFEQEKTSLGIDGVGRGDCQYAFLDEDSARNNEYGFNEDDYALVEMKVDPQQTRVTWGELYGRANMQFQYNQVGSARSYAKEYWERSVTLSDYLIGNHDLPDDSMVEALAPGTVSTDLLRVVEN